MRIFFSAGESSGDLHGSNLIQALRELEPALECVGLGGRRMAEAGMELRHDLAERAIMGFTEVVKSLGYIRRLLSESIEYLRQTRPDGLVVMDYPGFNIRLAKHAKALGIPVIYYISPQIWAWKKGRIHTIARIIEKMLVILPFEEKLYADVDVDCRYVGHPLLDHIRQLNPGESERAGRTIGVMPGSRAQEIGRLLPVMLEVAQGILDRHPDARFACPVVDGERERQVRAIAKSFPLEVRVGGTHDVLREARFCLVASGTATLETALFEVPFIVMYTVSHLTYWLARLLVKVDHIALVNILANKRLVPEFVQYAATAERMLPVALELIEDSPARQALLEGLSEIRRILGGEGASRTAALEVLETLAARNHG